MGRQRRPHLPGVVFHLTARTLRSERLFTPALRTEALSEVAAVVPASRARLLAVAIMSNHLHLVVQQGPRPVWALMQPLLRRLAHRLQRSHRRTGPVFWRPYAATPCLDPGHARNAIAYTHLNPVRAKICDDPGAYPWTSHALYADERARPRELAAIRAVLDPASALPLFSRVRPGAPPDLRADYDAFLRWRLAADRAMETGEIRPEPDDPDSRHEWRDGDWAPRLSPLFHAPAGIPRGDRDSPADPPGLDLASVARAVVAAEAPGLSVESVRGRFGGAAHSKLRRLLILRLHRAGHRNVEIARFLNLSESAVSRVIRLEPQRSR